MKRFLACLSLTLACAVIVSNGGTVYAAESAASVSQQQTTLSSTPSAYGEIIDLYTDKACYQPGDTAILTAKIKNSTGSGIEQTVTTKIYHLNQQVWESSENVTVAAGGTVGHNLSWQCDSADYTGYLVRVSLGNGSTKVTAIDVSSDVSRYPRYGYSVDFPVGESETESTSLMQELARDYHINLVQYYDWMWRHEKDIPSDTAVTWEDMFGNTISKASILQRINAGHNLNQKAMAYQMVYMAREGYENYGVSKEWGLYKNLNHNISYETNNPSSLNRIDQFIFPLEGKPFPILFVFNPFNESWRNFMSSQYTGAVNTFGFDGIQLDQMGDFWGNVNYYDYSGNSVDLANSFSSYVNEIKQNLTANNSSKNYITMNAVNGAASPNDDFSSNDIIKNANTDFPFSEIWENCSNYNDLKNYIDWQRKNDGGKTMVCAAYMNQYDNLGTTYQAESGTLSGVHSGTENNVTYVTGFDETGDYSSYTVQAPETGTYSLVFLASNGTDTRAQKSIYVDGTKTMVANFDSTRTGLIPADPSWYQYSAESSFTTPKTLYLTQGTHTIRIQQDSDNAGGDIRLDSITLGTFDSNSVRLTDAVLAASGAMHIEMGSGLSMANGSSGYSDAVMLGHPYYPKAYKSMRDNLRTAMKNQYNFITAYENLLYDPDIIPSDGGLQNISISGEAVSGSGEAGKIWFIPKNKGDDYGILHLINMTAETDTNWRNAAAAPDEKTNLTVKYYIPTYKSVAGVSVASPDTDEGISTALNYTVSTDSNGKYVTFTVPSLEYWDMIYLKWGSESCPSIIEAESSILSGVSTNTDHPGYTGTGFVDSYGTMYSSVTFDLDVPTTGYYNLKFRYSNATAAECKRLLIMDNASEGEVDFPVTADWNTWQESEKQVSMRAGMHRLVLLVSSGYEGYINLDHIEISS
ncbi:Cycloisomaltooligosaccharide glucanotransferase [Caprobacter fermentans]|uniref:Cycloisomaltooligosaccharide glucanotransferase n=1 Tax=Caproicibacter fermentans TaxID=2576756 RepID=A0A6N8I3E6_9FIRM|nr:glycoside hydrolase family 66 protein [Caproicibacter fermentans]MVB12445.1 Cycloisomaltooligosaccharide glucanotransferase [Caproicibacter fermentans]